jgi:cell wall-associated NlpC family hydrolase
MFDGLLGKPFIDGGRGPDAFDCWGCACEVWRRMTGDELPDYKVGAFESEKINGIYQKESERYIPVEGEPPVPSIIVFRFNTVDWVNHIGIYLGRSRFIHCRRKAGVVIERLDSQLWVKHIAGFYLPGSDLIEQS